MTIEEAERAIAACKNRDEAVTVYRLALREWDLTSTPPWMLLNQAILSRWKDSRAALQFIKEKAWKTLNQGALP